MIKDPDDVVYSAIIAGCNPTDKRVLDVGCGHGALTARLAELAKSATGIDPEPELIKQAREKYACPNVQFILADSIQYLEQNLRFDVVLFNKSLHHFEPEVMYQTLTDSAARLSEGDIILVVEPIFRGGTYQEVVAVFYNEQVQREAAKVTLEDFSKECCSLSRKQITVRYEVKDFDDLYSSEIAGKPYITWNDCFREEIERILSTCPRGSQGGFCLDSVLDIYQLRVR